MMITYESRSHYEDDLARVRNAMNRARYAILIGDDQKIIDPGVIAINAIFQEYRSIGENEIELKGYPLSLGTDRFIRSVAKRALGNSKIETKRLGKDAIKRVIFSGPATIIMWADGSKTVVKAQGDEAVDQEKGLALAIAKKVLGNEGNYYNVIKKALKNAEIQTNW